MLRQFTSFWVQVAAIVAVGFVPVALGVNLEPSSVSASLTIDGVIVGVAVAAVALSHFKPVAYLLAFLLAVAYWIGEIWETLSYFITGGALVVLSGWLWQLHLDATWNEPAWWVYVVGCTTIGAALLTYGLLGRLYRIEFMDEYKDGSIRPWHPIRRRVQWIRLSMMP